MLLSAPHGSPLRNTVYSDFLDGLLQPSCFPHFQTARFPWNEGLILFYCHVFFFLMNGIQRDDGQCGESPRCTCTCILGRCLPGVGEAFSPPEKRDCVCTGNAAPFAMKTLAPWSSPGLREWDCGCELFFTEADSSEKGVADQRVWLPFL